MFVVQGMNETVTFLYSLIREINLKVDTETSMARGEHSMEKTGIKVKSLSNHLVCMSLAVQVNAK